MRDLSGPLEKSVIDSVPELSLRLKASFRRSVPDLEPRIQKQRPNICLSYFEDSRMHGMTMCRYLNHSSELNGKECAHHNITAGGKPMSTEVYLTSGGGRAVEAGVHYISGSF